MATRTETCTEVAVRASPNPFSWEVLEDEPKVQRTCIGRSFRSTEYEILHTGGFVRLCTERGRVYWLAQNEHDHRLPDWKLHFSVHISDVPRAWNVLSELFLSQACDFGMKAVAGEALDSWPDEQRGRELTVYIFQDHPVYKGGGPMMGYCPGFEHNFWLGPEFERDSAFWLNFVVLAEKMPWLLQASGAAEPRTATCLWVTTHPSAMRLSSSSLLSSSTSIRLMKVGGMLPVTSVRSSYPFTSAWGWSAMQAWPSCASCAHHVDVAVDGGGKKVSRVEQHWLS